VANKQPKNPEKTVDLPPEGNRNADPITDQPGSHPIETGVGAAAAGAASAFAVGAVAGPVGAIAGAALGAVAGGLAGKGVGELIDPTTEDNWLRENFGSRPYVKKGETFEAYQPAYLYGAQAESRHSGKSFQAIEPELRTGWDQARGSSALTWEQARDAVKDAYDRTIQLREERLRVHKTPVQTGEVKVHKEVITEQKQIQVPVEREEVVIERRAVNRPGTAGEIHAEEVRIPVSEEEVHVHKETVVKEEVAVGKRKVQDTQEVKADVRHEELRVEREGEARVRGGGADRPQP